MGEDRKETLDDGTEVHPMDYARRSGRRGPRLRLTKRLIVEGVFTVGAGLSFVEAFCFYKELVTFPGVSSPLTPLCWTIAGCVAFGAGLVLTLVKARTGKVLDGLSTLCLIIGVASTLAGVYTGGGW